MRALVWVASLVALLGLLAGRGTARADEGEARAEAALHQDPYGSGTRGRISRFILDAPGAPLITRAERLRGGAIGAAIAFGAIVSALIIARRRLARAELEEEAAALLAAEFQALEEGKERAPAGRRSDRPNLIKGEH